MKVRAIAERAAMAYGITSIVVSLGFYVLIKKTESSEVIELMQRERDALERRNAELAADCRSLAAKVIEANTSVTPDGIFDVTSLRDAIVKRWGPAGAHVDVLDALIAWNEKRPDEREPGPGEPGDASNASDAT